MDKNKLKLSFYNTLDGYTWRPDKHIVSTMVEESVTAKKKILEVLRKHPNWVEDEMCIILSDKKQMRKFCETAIYDFTIYLVNSEEYVNFDDEKRARIKKAVEELRKINVQFFGQNERPIVDALNNLNSEYRLHYTGKASKVIWKVCKEECLDKIYGFDQEYAKLSDAINPKEIRVKEVISINPTDFLEMSNGESFNWNSCHNLCDGCHMAGTISYLLDSDSFLYYQVLEETPIDKIHNASRYLRQVWFYKDECLAQSRLYPQDNDSVTSQSVYESIRTTVLDVFSKCLNVEDTENPWLTSHKLAKKYIESGADDTAAYPDWEYGNPGSARCTISKLRNRTKMLPTFYAGVTARCVKCGMPHDYYDSLYCVNCG